MDAGSGVEELRFVRDWVICVDEDGAIGDNFEVPVALVNDVVPLVEASAIDSFREATAAVQMNQPYPILFIGRSHTRAIVLTECNDCRGGWSCTCHIRAITNFRRIIGIVAYARCIQKRTAQT